MGRLKSENRGRWFLTHQLWELENAEEIRAAARAANVRLVAAEYREKDEAEAAGKPAEIPIKKVSTGHSDSGQSVQKEASDAAAQATKAAKEAEAAEAAAKAEAAAEKAKAEAAAKAKADADAKAAAAEKAKAAASESKPA